MVDIANRQEKAPLLRRKRNQLSASRCLAG